jgi:hypothetical protein
MALAIGAICVVLVALALFAYGPAAVSRLRRGRREARRRERIPDWDPGRERRAERRARELLRTVVGPDEYAMYVELGFLRVARDGHRGGYGYLIYPHRPIVAYDAGDGSLLNEYCVEFPDRSDATAAVRLPDADDVLAKWMALQGDERNLIAGANMHMPGRQVDPDQVRRDLRRLEEWEGRRRAAA